MAGSDTHYTTGEEIRAGDQVRWADGFGTVVFVIGNGSFAEGYQVADWAYLGRGIMVNSDQAGFVFHPTADEDLTFVCRAEASGNGHA
jgi:hypothetical protein